MSKFENEMPEKLSTEGVRGEIKIAIEDLQTVGGILIHLGMRVPHDEIQPDWLQFFGRAIDRITDRLAAAEERAP